MLIILFFLFCADRCTIKPIFNKLEVKNYCMNHLMVKCKEDIRRDCY